MAVKKWFTKNATEWLQRLIEAFWDSTRYTWDSEICPWDGRGGDKWYNKKNTDWEDQN